MGHVNQKKMTKVLKNNAKELIESIIKKFGSIKNFASLANVDKTQILFDLEIELTSKSFKMIHSLFEETDNEKSVLKITPNLKEILHEKILAHSDSKNDKKRSSYREFFVKNPTWTNTYFSEVMNGKRTRISTKLKLLCRKLEIEIEKYI